MRRLITAGEGGQHELGHVLALGGHRVLAFDAHGESPVVGQRLQLLLDEVGHPLLQHEHAALAVEEIDELLGHQRMNDVEHEEGNAAPPEDVRLTE